MWVYESPYYCEQLRLNIWCISGSGYHTLSPSKFVSNSGIALLIVFYEAQILFVHHQRKLVSTSKCGHFLTSIWTIPVRLIPVLRISIASTVIVAGLANPDNTFACGYLCHDSSTISRTITRIAVTLNGNHSVANKTRARRISMETTIISLVTEVELTLWINRGNLERDIQNQDRDKENELVLSQPICELPSVYLVH
jgi:hypothetical protein